MNLDSNPIQDSSPVFYPWKSQHHQNRSKPRLVSIDLRESLQENPIFNGNIYSVDFPLNQSIEDELQTFG